MIGLLPLDVRALEEEEGVAAVVVLDVTGFVASELPRLCVCSART